MHTLRDNGDGTFDVVFISGRPEAILVIERGWDKQDARTMVHFLNGGNLNAYGGVVITLNEVSDE